MKRAMTVVLKAAMVAAVVTGFVFAGSAYSERVISVSRGEVPLQGASRDASVVARATGAAAAPVAVGGATTGRMPLKGL
ncbi:MAG: hypothetical protein H0S85_13295 [Desulfovibrionaceae bacterium]|nr:hypothetical protein [Desulfovibrionaceae bacterium]